MTMINLKVQVRKVKTMTITKVLFVAMLWTAVSACSPDKPQVQIEKDEIVISAGEQAYQKHCANCHMLPRPDAFEGQAWVPVIERMMGYHAAKALPPITSEDKALIMDYLIEGKSR